MEKLFIYKCENITMKNGLVNNFVYAYNLTKDKYMYLLNSDLKEYDVTYLDWLVNDFYYIYGPIMLEETVKKNYVGEELFKEVATHINSEYTIDDDIKIEIHKKINEVDSYSKLLEIKKELEDRFGKITTDMEIYMYSEWFEKLVKKLKIEKVNQTKNYIEVILPREISTQIDGEKLFMDAYYISRMFRFNFKNEKISIILDTIKLEKNYLIYLNNLLEIVINYIEEKK